MPENLALRHKRFQHLSRLALVVMILSLISRSVLAEDLLEDRYQGSKEFLVEMSGSNGKENFTHVRGSVTLMPAAEDKPYPYIVVVKGWPTLNEKNCFFWNSEEGRLEASSTSVRCSIPGGLGRMPDIHFFYLSPSLLKSRGMSTHHEDERSAMARKRALPTLVYAQAGEMVLNFQGNQISGEVSMNGYDPVGHEFVRYHANMHGSLLQDDLVSKRRIWKYD